MNSAHSQNSIASPNDRNKDFVFTVTYKKAEFSQALSLSEGGQIWFFRKTPNILASVNYLKKDVYELLLKLRETFF